MTETILCGASFEPAGFSPGGVRTVHAGLNLDLPRSGAKSRPEEDSAKARFEAFLAGVRDAHFSLYTIAIDPAGPNRRVLTLVTRADGSPMELAPLDNPAGLEAPIFDWLEERERLGTLE